MYTLTEIHPNLILFEFWKSINTGELRNLAEFGNEIREFSEWLGKFYVWKIKVRTKKKVLTNSDIKFLNFVGEHTLPFCKFDHPWHPSPRHKNGSRSSKWLLLKRSNTSKSDAYILKARIVGFKIPQKKLNFPQIFRNFFCWERAKLVILIWLDWLGLVILHTAPKGSILVKIYQ